MQEDEWAGWREREGLLVRATGLLVANSTAS